MLAHGKGSSSNSPVFLLFAGSPGMMMIMMMRYLGHASGTAVGKMRHDNVLY